MDTLGCYGPRMIISVRSWVIASNSLVVLFLDSTLFSYVKGRVGSPASGGTLFQDEAVLWCEERSDTI